MLSISPEYSQLLKLLPCEMRAMFEEISVPAIYKIYKEKKAVTKERNRKKAAKWKAKQNPSKIKSAQRKWQKTYLQKLKVTDPAGLKVYYSNKSVPEFRKARYKKYMEENK